MRALLFTFLPLTLLLARPAEAVKVEDLEGSSWYLHVDFDMMRQTEAGRGIDGWLNKEVFADIAKDTQVDLRGKLRTLTAFADQDKDAIVELQGRIDRDTRERILSLASPAAEKRAHGGKTYYRIKEDRYESDDGEVKIDIDSDWFITFELQDRIVLAQTEKRLQRVLDSGGKLPIKGGANNAIFVLSGEKRLVQAGADADRLGKIESGGDWDSNILKNTKKVGLLVADDAGKLAIDLRLHASERKMAESLRNIVLGLIGLSMFSEDMDPDVAALLRSANVTLEDTVLRVRLAATPEAFLKVVD